MKTYWTTGNSKALSSAKMEEEHNWALILKVAVPFALAEAYVFYTDIDSLWKSLLLVLGLSLTGVLVYMNDKKKGSLFTSMGIVLLAALIMRFLKNSGLL